MESNHFVVKPEHRRCAQTVSREYAFISTREFLKLTVCDVRIAQPAQVTTSSYPS